MDLLNQKSTHVTLIYLPVIIKLKLSKMRL